MPATSGDKDGWEIFNFIMVCLAFIGGAGVVAAAVITFIMWGDKMAILSAIVRAYVLLTGSIVMCAEFKFFKGFMRQFRFLRSWVGRGFFHIFVGLLQAQPIVWADSFEDEICPGPSDGKLCDCYIVHDSDERLARFIPGFFLAGVGCVFFVAGFISLCVLGKGDPGLDGDDDDDYRPRTPKSAAAKTESAPPAMAAAPAPAAGSASQPPPNEPFAI